MKKSAYIKIGAIVTFAIVALVWGMNFLKGKGTFDNAKHHYVIYEKIGGLEVSNPVLVNGFKVGQVNSIKLLPGGLGNLLVEFTIDKDIELPRVSTARIFSSDLMGTKAIELIYGKEQAKHHDGDTLLADFEGSLTEMVSVQMLPLKNKAEDLMKDMEELIEIVKYIFNEQNRQNLTESFENIKITFANLEQSTSTVDTIVQESRYKLDSILHNINSISYNLEQNNENISNVLSNFSNISDSIAQADILALLNNMGEVAHDLNKITTGVTQGEGTLGALVNNDTLYKNLEDVSYNLNRLVEDLRVNPKRYVQFSVFNTGKTVVVEDISTEKMKKEKIRYMIQIDASNTPIPLLPENFKGYKNVEEISQGGSYIYVHGSKKKIENVKRLLKEVQELYPDAFILEQRAGKYTRVY